ncbi:uncharacterized protein METZ01_LOCUS262819 [marine metagenome]|uniref:Uncharacterized protein n=1 Tax=marine metagenome TaxID=408172 RepID=A0A382JEB3_9ZZZZ
MWKTLQVFEIVFEIPLLKRLAKK